MISLESAAEALKPIAGEYTYVLFATGVLGTGFLAIPVLAGSIGYMFSDMFGWGSGLNKKWDQAPGFYVIMMLALAVGLAIDLIGLPPMKSLIYAAILYGITSPVLVGILMNIANDKKLMGKHKNGPWFNVFGTIAFAVITLASLALIYYSIV